ncbi:MAG: twin-arginine translocation signal domain-containing protein, partial [Candidatus Faecalibacterium intestinavium]|nr:twin-arginine translocation signal domain-containing protein [Candidatus Faecalibacterium intestinavium]
MKKISRRSFLQAAAVVAGATALTCLLYTSPSP